MDGKLTIKLWTDAKFVDMEFLASSDWTLVNQLKHVIKDMHEIDSRCSWVVRDLDRKA